MSQVTESQDNMLALMKEREREAYERGRREELAKAVKREALAVREARRAALEEAGDAAVKALGDVRENERRAVSKGSAPYELMFRHAVLVKEVASAIEALAAALAKETP